MALSAIDQKQLSLEDSNSDVGSNSVQVASVNDSRMKVLSEKETISLEVALYAFSVVEAIESNFCITRGICIILKQNMCSRVDAACANNLAVSHRSVELLRDCSAALLDNVSGFDLKHFHFNETLLQPFQTILCLELCDEQCVDAILCAIAELVESYKQDIFTGWRSLFGALRAARNHFLLYEHNLPVDNVQHFHNAFVDVFSTFLKSDNAKTFCRASSDCIFCLLRFLTDDRAPLASLDYDNEEDSLSPDFNENARLGRKTSATPNFAQTALCFLRQCHSLLVSTYEICDDDLLVHLIHRLTEKNHSTECIDRDIPSTSDMNMPSLASVLAENQSAFFGWNFSPHFLDLIPGDKPIDVPWTNLSVGKRLICEIWIDLIDGLISSIISSSADIQPEVIECVYDILEMMINVPGIDFGAYCINHILLPTLQRWLRRETVGMQDHDFRENKNGVRNFKHCVGLLMESVCSYIKADSGATCTRFLLLQSLDLLVECASTSSEFIARLSCSSLRHLIETSKQNFTVELWSCVCRSLWRYGDVTLRPLRLLMNCFEKNSTRYDGDSGRSVQVAIRKDTNPTEAARLRILAQQVFLAECQKYEQNLEEKPDKLSQSYRSVVFLLKSVDGDENATTIRLTFRKIVVGLLTHQLFLQLIGSLLCNGTDFKVPSRCTALTKHLTTNSDQENIDDVSRQLWYARALSLRYARLCSLICKLEQPKNGTSLTTSNDNATPILEFLRANTQYEEPPIVESLLKDEADSNSSSSLETDIEGVGRLADETDGKSQEQIYTLASNDYIENCLKNFKHNKKKNQGGLLNVEEFAASGEVNTESSIDCKRINPFHGDQTSYRTENDRSKDFEAYEHSSLKNEATTAFLEDKQIAQLAWSEMVTSLPAMIITIDDAIVFKNMIPLFFGPLTRTATLSASTPVKLLLVDLLYKLSDVFRFLENDGNKE